MASVRNTTPWMKNTERRGEYVRVTLFGGDIVERVVWEECEEVVYLCSERCFSELVSSGGSAFRPVAYPREDIQWRTHAT